MEVKSEAPGLWVVIWALDPKQLVMLGGSPFDPFRVEPKVELMNADRLSSTRFTPLWKGFETDGEDRPFTPPVLLSRRPARR
jgi:hypothetical protein